MAGGLEEHPYQMVQNSKYLDDACPGRRDNQKINYKQITFWTVAMFGVAGPFDAPHRPLEEVLQKRNLRMNGPFILPV